MHRQTIDSYDNNAARWRETRRPPNGDRVSFPAAEAFRRDVGEGLVLDLGCGPGAQHLPRAQFAVALAEVARVLRPGGLVELWMHADEGTDGVRENDDMGIGRWFTYWSADDLAVALPLAGLEVLAIEDQQYARRTRARRPG